MLYKAKIDILKLAVTKNTTIFNISKYIFNNIIIYIFFSFYAKKINFENTLIFMPNKNNRNHYLNNSEIIYQNQTPKFKNISNQYNFF